MASEPTVKQGALPANYSFVPKGNVYITANCRKETQGAGKIVYVVVNSKTCQVGIAVPSRIHSSVRQKEVQTRADRAKNVEKRDACIEKGFEEVVRHEFPRIPAADLPQVLEVALKKGKGKVGRTGTLDMHQKAHLAVRAHIRHCHTPYEALMKGQPRGQATRNKARDAVQDQVDSTARSWGGEIATKRPRKQAKKQARAKAATVKAVPGASATASATTPEKTPATTQQQQAISTGQQPLPAVHRRAGRAARRHPRKSPDHVIDLTLDDSDSSTSVRRSPRSRVRHIPKTNDAQSTDLPDMELTPWPAGRPAKTTKGSWAWMREGPQLRVAGALPPAQRERTTRSMRSIEEPIQELVQRLPDSPEPEPYRPARQGLRGHGRRTRPSG